MRCIVPSLSDVFGLRIFNLPMLLCLETIPLPEGEQVGTKDAL